MCPACGGDELSPVPAAGLELLRCVACGVHVGAFAASRDTSDASVDPGAYANSIGVVRRQQSEVIVAFVREQLPCGDWLDVGCGHGYAVEAAREAGYAARGIEPDPIAVRTARERGLDVTPGLLSEETEGADVVSALDVLEHVEDLDAFARLVKRKVRRLWVIKVPSSDGMFFRIAHAMRIAPAIARLWQTGYEHPHRVYFSESSLRAFLARHNFEVVATRYLQEVPVHTAVARLTLDGTMSRWAALLAVPVILAVNAIESLRGRSDALLVIARPQSGG